MRIIARKTLADFWGTHPETEAPLRHWLTVVRAAKWANMAEVQGSFSRAVVLNSERARFEIHGGDYRLIVAFKFGPSPVAFVKFIGTHKEYDRIDALKVSLF